MLHTLAWPVSAHQLGGGFDRLWRCRWSWCGPCIYPGSMQLQVTQTQTVIHCRFNKTKSICTVCISLQCVLTQHVSVAEMWRWGWRRWRRWGKGGQRLPNVGVSGSRGGGHGWWGRGWGGGQILKVLLSWFILLESTPWINLQISPDPYRCMPVATYPRINMHGHIVNMETAHTDLLQL